MASRLAPRHIAIYLHTLYNGGVERVMFTLAEGFLEQGIKVDLVLDFLIYSPFEALLPKGVRLVNLKADRFALRIPRLVGYLRRHRPDAMLSAAHFSNETACVAKAVSRARMRLVLSEHTNLSADIVDSRPRARRVLLPWTTRTVYPLADAVVAVSNGVAEDMCRVSGFPLTRVRTIYNPIDRDELLAMAEEPVDHPWFRAGEPPVILGIGRLEAQKDFACLLRAFSELRRRCEARLVVFGEGSQRTQLAALATELGVAADVALPGFVANPAAFMNRSAVFAMSSRWEGMPVALMEALTLGVPIVTTDCPSGPAEILDGGRYGRLVPMRDSKALAEAIEAALNGGRAPTDRTWLARFDAKAITRQYLDLMSSSVAARTSKHGQ